MTRAASNSATVPTNAPNTKPIGVLISESKRLLPSCADDHIYGAADNHCDESWRDELLAHERCDRHRWAQIVRRKSRKAGAEAECEHRDSPRVDAQGSRHCMFLHGGTRLQAERCIIVKRPEADDQHTRQRNDRQPVNSENEYCPRRDIDLLGIWIAGRNGPKTSSGRPGSKSG